MLVTTGDIAVGTCKVLSKHGPEIFQSKNKWSFHNGA